VNLLREEDLLAYQTLSIGMTYSERYDTAEYHTGVDISDDHMYILNVDSHELKGVVDILYKLCHV
jgi:transketolase